jgi:hypothetical protein
MAPILHSRFANSEYISFAQLGYTSAMIDTIYGGDERARCVERFEVTSLTGWYLYDPSFIDLHHAL